MIRSTPLPPPSPAPAPTASTASTVRTAQRPAWVHWLLAVTAAVLAAIVVGGGLGLTAASSSASNCSPNDGWCGLGAAIVGLTVAVLAGTVAYVVAGALVVRRLRPPGERATVLTATIATPVALGLLLLLLTALVDVVT